MVRILGIVNVTRDSFSNGGRHADPEAALAHGRLLLREGADVIDVGAESTHPDSEDVPAEVEIGRLSPVVEGLLAMGVEVSVDTVKPGVMRAMGMLGVSYLNDVHGMRDPAAIAAAASCAAKVIVMFSRAKGPRAERRATSAEGLLGDMRTFFEDRLTALEAGGVAQERVILDPGMGFFLGSSPEPSLCALRRLGELHELGRPLLVCTSRKSFLGAITERPVDQRGAATLASELWAVQQGVDYIRTHEPRPLRDAVRVLDAIRGELL